MDIELQMWMWEETPSKNYSQFPLLAFYPGRVQEKGKNEKYWSVFMENKTIMPIAHYMELAYQLNNMVIYKASDLVTQRLIDAQINQKVFEAKLDVNIKMRDDSRLWQGSYNFDFKVEKIKPNNTDNQGHKWDIALLQIIDKTETISFPDS